MSSQKGFTLIEILMVTLLLAILSAVAIPQFLDFRTEARDAATQQALMVMRSAIEKQRANIIIRCGANGYPNYTQLNNNDVTYTAGGSGLTVYCTPDMIPVASERRFFTGPVPDNPWSPGETKNGIQRCTGTGCANYKTVSCNSTPYGPLTSGWCYDGNTGRIWANTANSTGPVKENLF